MPPCTVSISLLASGSISRLSIGVFADDLCHRSTVSAYVLIVTRWAVCAAQGAQGGARRNLVGCPALVRAALLSCMPILLVLAAAAVVAIAD